ncbi:hypothetical protein ABPG72_017438 [Tetrahymena utriculariae]
MKRINPLLSQIIQNNQRISISPLFKLTKLQEQALQIVSKIFSTLEPITIEVNATQDDVYRATKDIFKSSLQHSSIAYSPHDDKILGVIVSSDVFQQQKLTDEDIKKLPSSMQSIFSLLDICSEKFYQKKQIEKQNLLENQILSQMMLAVLPEAAGMNLGVNILQHNLQLAQINKFQMTKIECTSKKSAKLGLKLDYEIIDEVQYSNVSVGDENHFFWKDVPAKYNEEKLTILSKQIKDFNSDKYNFNQQNILQFLF